MKIVKVSNDVEAAAVRLPTEFQDESDEVLIKRIGVVGMTTPQTKSWVPLLDSLSQFSNDFMVERMQPEALACLPFRGSADS